MLKILHPRSAGEDATGRASNKSIKNLIQKSREDLKAMKIWQFVVEILKKVEKRKRSISNWYRRALTEMQKFPCFSQSHYLQ
jgi:thymidylate synthase